MATQDPCALLDRLCREASESEWLEFKVNNDDPKVVGEYVSALANSAMLADRDRAFLVYGVDNKSRKKVGTKVRLKDEKHGGENLENYINRMIEPRLMLEFIDFSCDGKDFSIITIEPTYDRPVKFSGSEFVRIGENKRRLIDHPSHERALWLATGRRKFEDAVAATNQSADQIFEKLDSKTIYTLSGEPEPKSRDEVLRKMLAAGLINDNMEGRYDVTNLGAILLAKDLSLFPSIASKSIRVVKYVGRDKRKSDFEQEGTKGYAVGFSGMIRYIMNRIPSDEVYVDGVRRNIPVYPEVAIRELIANALIHQDFTITGSGPVIEIYSDRIEIINPGNSLIEPDRMLDERRSRNEKLASTMRGLGLCEERGGGLDKTMIELEHKHLPAPDFISSRDSMRVVLFGPKTFGEMTKQEKQRACFYHAIIRWLSHDYMGNSSLRERFSLPNDEYQAVSTVISEAVKAGRIRLADPNQGRKNARYVPYWAR